MSWWVWVLVGFVLLGAEFASATLHIGFFAVGAFLVALLVGAGVEMELWLQIVVFTVSSLVAFFFIRPPVMRRLKLNETRVVDTLVGEAALALEDIDAGSSGRAEMRGTTWAARNVGETMLTRGQRCTVAGVDGLVIHVRAS